MVEVTEVSQAELQVRQVLQSVLSRRRKRKDRDFRRVVHGRVDVLEDVVERQVRQVAGGIRDLEHAEQRISRP